MSQVPSDPEPRRRLPLLTPERGDHLALRDGLRRFIARRVRTAHVDDLVQDVFLRMQEHALDLRDGRRMGAWAFRIARNVVVDHHRRANGVAPPAPSDDLPADLGTADGELNELVAGWLRPMLTLLPAEYAQALELVELERLSQKEYASRAGLSLSGAKSRVQRARTMLEGIVRACCDLEQDARGNVIGFTRRRDGADESSRRDT